MFKTFQVLQNVMRLRLGAGVHGDKRSINYKMRAHSVEHNRCIKSHEIGHKLTFLLSNLLD